MTVIIEDKGVSIALDGSRSYTLGEIKKKLTLKSFHKWDLVIFSYVVETRRFDIRHEVVIPRQKALKLKNIVLGKRVYFGEIDGRHSEIHGDVQESEITVLDDEDRVLEFIDEHGREYFNYSMFRAFMENLEGDENVSDEDYEKMELFFENMTKWDSDE